MSEYANIDSASSLQNAAVAIDDSIFHKDGNRDDMVELLKRSGPGSFLLRPSSRPGNVSLSIFANNTVNHLLVVEVQGEWVLAFPNSGPVFRGPTYVDCVRAVFEKRYEVASIIGLLTRPVPSQVQGNTEYFNLDAASQSVSAAPPPASAHASSLQANEEALERMRLERERLERERHDREEQARLQQSRVVDPPPALTGYAGYAASAASAGGAQYGDFERVDSVAPAATAMPSGSSSGGYAQGGGGGDAQYGDFDRAGGDAGAPVGIGGGSVGGDGYASSASGGYAVPLASAASAADGDSEYGDFERVIASSGSVGVGVGSVGALAAGGAALGVSGSPSMINFDGSAPGSLDPGSGPDAETRTVLPAAVLAQGLPELVVLINARRHRDGLLQYSEEQMVRLLGRGRSAAALRTALGIEGLGKPFVQGCFERTLALEALLKTGEQLNQSMLMALSSFDDMLFSAPKGGDAKKFTQQDFTETLRLCFAEPDSADKKREAHLFDYIRLWVSLLRAQMGVTNTKYAGNRKKNDPGMLRALADSLVQVLAEEFEFLGRETGESGHAKRIAAYTVGAIVFGMLHSAYYQWNERDFKMDSKGRLVLGKTALKTSDYKGKLALGAIMQKAYHGGSAEEVENPFGFSGLLFSFRFMKIFPSLVPYFIRLPVLSGLTV